MKLTRAKRNRLIYNFVTYALVIAAFIILQSMIDRKTITRSLKGQLVPICCWIVMAVSLNLVVGISGELSLGHAGFMSVGAYTGAVVSGWLLTAFEMQDTLRLNQRKNSVKRRPLSLFGLLSENFANFSKFAPSVPTA